LGRHYGQARDVDDLDKQITGTVTRLYSLSRPIPLDPSARLSLLSSIDEVRDTNRWMGIIGAQLLGQITHLRMVPSEREMRASLAMSGTIKFCQAHGLPLRPLSEAAKPDFS